MMLTPEYQAAISLANSQEPICPKCGTTKQRPDWVFCIGCIAQITPEGIAQMRRERDELAKWLVEAEAFLQQMDPTDQRFIDGKETWDKRLKLYEVYAWICPEVVA